MKTYNKTELKDKLKDNILCVKFRKKDQSTREMLCTLMESFLPISEKKESTKKENDNVIAAWDIEKEAFRSFRLDSILDVQFE